jgi:hypothetical protein
LFFIKNDLSISIEMFLFALLELFIIDERALRLREALQSFCLEDFLDNFFVKQYNRENNHLSSGSTEAEEEKI